MRYDINIDNRNQIILCSCEGILDIDSAKTMTRDARKQSFELAYQ